MISLKSLKTTWASPTAVTSLERGVFFSSVTLTLFLATKMTHIFFWLCLQLVPWGPNSSRVRGSIRKRERRNFPGPLCRRPGVEGRTAEKKKLYTPGGISFGHLFLDKAEGPSTTTTTRAQFQQTCRGSCHCGMAQERVWRARREHALYV